MLSNNKPLIAVIGATGHRGGGFDEIVDTLNRQGHNFSVNQIIPRIGQSSIFEKCATCASNTQHCAPTPNEQL